MLGYLGLATLQAVVALAETVLLFQLQYEAGTLLGLFFVIWLLAIASVMLGIFVSTFARNTAQVFPFIPLVILPSVFLSGLLIDIAGLPGWAQVLGRAFPFYYANLVIQELTGAIPGESGWWNAAILAGYGLLLLALASRTLREVE